MTAQKKTLNKSWISAALAGALFASVSALPAEAGGHDHRGQGGHGGGFRGHHQMQRPMPQMQRPQIQHQPRFQPAPRMQQQFNRGPDPRVIQMQNQVRQMQNQARQMQRLQQQQQRIQLQQQFRRQQNWRPDQLQMRRYYNNPALYGGAAAGAGIYYQQQPPVYQQGPTREDYDECAAVQQESNGCYVDMRGNIHYIEQPQQVVPQIIPERDNGAGAAAAILQQTLETVKDVVERDKLQKQLLELQQQKKAVEAERDELLKKQKSQPVPEPTVESGELKGDDAAKAKAVAPKP